MLINSSKELIDYLQTNFPKRLLGSLEHWHTVVKKVFRDYTFTGSFSILFKDCKFVNCRFENVSGFFCLFTNCKFENNTFLNSRFSHIEEYWQGLEFKKCFFKSVQLDEGTFSNVFFNDCHFEMFYMTDFLSTEDTIFNDCYIQSSQFLSINHANDEKFVQGDFHDMYFENCIIDRTGFNYVDLRYCNFINTILFDTSFVNCSMLENTIIKTERLKYDSQASIDLQTIIKSENISFDILKHYFNINDPNIKTIVSKVATKVEFKKVFISFSFKDKKFVQRLYDQLTSKGIPCFFWMKDAPPGQPLEDIMTSGIKVHDKVLFIASKDSLKSNACQFELSEGRKKQAETWENTIFPIHIDDFLFQVTKNQIRPIEQANEYWANIEEIKRVNSVDFSEFNKDRINIKKFKEAINKIVTALRLQ